MQKNWRTICQDDSGLSYDSTEKDSAGVNLCQVLLDLCRHKNTEICKRSLKILTKMHFIDKDLFDKVVKV